MTEETLAFGMERVPSVDADAKVQNLLDDVTSELGDIAACSHSKGTYDKKYYLLEPR